MIRLWLMGEALILTVGVAAGLPGAVGALGAGLADALR